MKTYALVDCDNFFVSCERIFRPDLNKRPVLILSGSEGCVVARSDEVKNLGIKMSQPYFQCKDSINRHKVTVFNSNITLYNDISHRIMVILSTYVADIEQYSVDEAFLDITCIDRDLRFNYCVGIKSKLKQHIGAPVSICIANTKTLCKIGSTLVKKYLNIGHVIDMTAIDNEQVDRYLHFMPVRDIWGIGRISSNILEQCNIKTAYDLKYANSHMVKTKIGIMGERTMLELNNISCYNMKKKEVYNKSLSHTRTFRHPVSSRDLLDQYLSGYVNNLAMKLRKKNCLTNQVTVILNTNPFSDKSYYSNKFTSKLTYSTSDTSHLSRAARSAFYKIYKKEHSYKRVGVIMSEIKPKTYQQYDIFRDKSDFKQKDRDKLMKLVDSINVKLGSGTVRTASSYTKDSNNQDYRKLRRYTTCWDELLEI